MASEYLIDIHNYISEKIVLMENRKADADAKKDRAYLTVHFNPKHPRRIRERYKF